MNKRVEDLVKDAEAVLIKHAPHLLAKRVAPMNLGLQPKPARRKRVIALDLGLHSLGYVIADLRKNYIAVSDLCMYGTVNLSTGVPGRINLDVLESLLLAVKPELIMFEALVTVRGRHEWRRAVGVLEKFIIDYADDHGQPEPIGIAVSSIKKHLTGEGRATKSKVTKAVGAWLGAPLRTTKDNDIADAIACLLTGVAKYGAKIF